MQKIEIDRASIECCARAAHEANRAFADRLGTQEPAWEQADDRHKESVREGVINVIENNLTPEQGHENWRARKIAEGWTHGEVKDIRLKTHPALVPYGDLPLEQKVKNEMFSDIVKAVYRAQRAVPQ